MSSHMSRESRTNYVPLRLHHYGASAAHTVTVSKRWRRVHLLLEGMAHNEDFQATT